MKKKLLIFGTGLLAEVASTYFKEYSNYNLVGYITEKKYFNQKELFNLPIYEYENFKIMNGKDQTDIFIAVGYSKNNKIRERIYNDLKSMNFSFASFVHPSVKIFDNSKIGEHVFILENNTIQPFVKIDDNCILWSGNHIGHHSKINKHCFISSHVVISGSCTIGNNTFIGVNSTLHDNIKIGIQNIIGAGSIIRKSTEDYKIYIPRNYNKLTDINNEK